MNKKRYLMLSFLLTFITLFSGAQSIVNPNLSLPQIVYDADVIIRGEVLAKDASWVNDRMIFTEYEMMITDTIYNGINNGFLDGQKFFLRIAGGTVDTIQLRVGHLPEFSIGEDLVLFLFEKDRNAWSPLVGTYQGFFRIKEYKGKAIPFNYRHQEVNHLFEGQHASGADALIESIRSAAETIKSSPVYDWRQVMGFSSEDTGSPKQSQKEVTELPEAMSFQPLTRIPRDTLTRSPNMPPIVESYHAEPDSIVFLSNEGNYMIYSYPENDTENRYVFFANPPNKPVTWNIPPKVYNGNNSYGLNYEWAFSRWNRYRNGVHNMYVNPDNSMGWNLRFDFGFLSANVVQSVYGVTPSANWIGVCVTLVGLITNKIREADVILNSEVQWTTDYNVAFNNNNIFYAPSTMVHELGHAIGIGHPWEHGSSFDEEANTVMQYAADRKLDTERWRPYMIDARAIRSAYGSTSINDFGVYLHYTLPGEGNMLWSELPPDVKKGESFTIQNVVAENLGTSKDERTIHFALTSERGSYSGTNYYLGSRELPSLARNEYVVFNQELTVPGIVADGPYYIAANIGSDDYNGNQSTWSKDQILVYGDQLVWTGVHSSEWTNPQNWSLPIVPDETTNVLIPAGTPYLCGIISNVKCLNLEIEHGAYLHINHGILDVYGSFYTWSGSTFTMTGGGYLFFRGNRNAAWFNKSQNNIFTNIEISKPGATLTIFDDISCSGFFHIYDGRLKLVNTKTLTINNPSSDAFWVYGGGVLELNAGRTLNVAGSIVFDTGSQADITGGTIQCGGNLIVQNNTAEPIDLSNATLIFNSTGNQFIRDYSGGSLQLHHLTIDKGGGAVYPSHANLNINGDLVILNGKLSSRAGPSSSIFYDIKIRGDWTNANFPTGFEPAGGRVVFIGGDYVEYQNVWTNEHFNILEANLEGKIRLVGSNVVCNQYAWQSGGLEVYSGSFSALDLAQNGIYGSFTAREGSLIDLTNSQGTTWVDLRGSLFNYGGTINISGSYSYWPYADDVHVEMTHGIIDIKTCALTIASNNYEWFYNVTGGTIRTASSLIINRPDFNPFVAGTFELYGPNNAFLWQVPGSTLPNIIIDKGGKHSSGDKPLFPSHDKRSGIRLSDGGKSGLVQLATDLEVARDLTIQSGVLDIQDKTLSANRSIHVYGTLLMKNAESVLHVSTEQAGVLYFFPGSTGHFTHGSAFINSWIAIDNGASFYAGPGNTIHLTSQRIGGLGNSDPETVFGNININKVNRPIALASDHSGPYVVEGDFILQSDNTLRIPHNKNVLLHIKGTFWDKPTSSVYLYHAKGDQTSKIADDHFRTENENPDGQKWAASVVFDNDLLLAGKLDLFNGSVLVKGQLTCTETSSVFITGSGSLIVDAPFAGSHGWQPIMGNLTMSAGLIEATNNSVRFDGTANVNISGGIIRTNSFYAGSGAFQPTGGLVEIIHHAIPDATIDMNSGNHFYNLTLSRMPAQTTRFIKNNVTVKNNLSILSGRLIHDVNKLYVGGNWLNNVGVNGFGPKTGEVIFDGTSDQSVLGNNLFYNLVNDKISGVLIFNDPNTVGNTFLANGVNAVLGATLDINGVLNLSAGQLDINTSGIVTTENFNMGGTLNVQGGSFSCSNIINNGIYGSILLDGGEVILTQTGAKYTDLNCNLEIHGGSMTINGTYSESFWGWGSAANITMTGGILDFKNPGVIVDAALPVSTDISGGKILTGGNFRVSNSGFTPTGGVVELYGTEPVQTQTSNNSHFFDLLINKNGTKRKDIEGIIKDEDAVVSTTNMLTVANNTIIEYGTLEIEHTAANLGDVQIGQYGRLAVAATGTLALGNESSLSVSDGGKLDVLGNETHHPKITSFSDGYYAFNIENGGVIAAEYAIFEHMDENGINIKPGAYVDPDRSFNNCIFRNGQNGGRLLTINNDGVFEVQNAVFPENTWNGQYNVYKNVNTGYVTFTGQSGNFSGSLFEYDPYDRISWEEEPQLTAEPLVQHVAQDAGTITFDILSNVVWYISENNDWLSVAPESGSNDATIAVTYEKNTAAEERTGVIYLQATGVPDVILQVVQSGATIQIDVVIADHQVVDGESVCFDALQTITVSNFNVEAGGSATFIAGQSIYLMPGTNVDHGGYLLARIATNADDYCGIPLATKVSENPISNEGNMLFARPYEQIRKNSFFIIYPNPTAGSFTLELAAIEPEQGIRVEVFAMLGERLFSKELPTQKLHTLSLEGYQPGMYIIRVMKGDKAGIERLIKR